MRNYILSSKGLEMIKKWEGCRLTAYQDLSGVWTIGFGWTNAVDGILPKKGMTITQEKANQLLTQGVQNYVNGVNAKLEKNCNQNQFDAMCSLCYNIGIGAFQGSTLLRLFNEGNVSGASEQFLVWNKSGGKTIQGLINRRKDEKAMFDSGIGVVDSSNIIEGGSLRNMALKVISGEYGNGEQRKSLLGNNYTGVQAIVNKELGSISYLEMTKVLANEVIKGMYGNGEQRKILLGEYYSNVQTIVNSLM